jgi:class 3 adenylate cyclase
MQVAAKKQREKANSLRRRYSQSKDATEIENSARRQSAIMLNEFKELVKTVADDTGEVQATETEQGQSSNPRRESAALDQALVRQMLPRKVCIPLREGKKVPPEAFQGVSIFFSDVVGFTTISSEVEPIIVHELLNSLFTVMDYCTALFPLYKVETIGDAYMVAGGLPEPNAHNARDLADFALVVSAVVAACVRSPVDGSPIQIRMGCHTGDVMAGVVGTLMPRYCLFGDSVNTASRMESNGAPGKIHCSEAFAMKVREGGLHTVAERGEIAVKGKGAMRTFWLDGAAEGNLVSSHAAIAEVIARCEELLADE